MWSAALPRHTCNHTDICVCSYDNITVILSDEHVYIYLSLSVTDTFFTQLSLNNQSINQSSLRQQAAQIHIIKMNTPDKTAQTQNYKTESKKCINTVHKTA